MKSILPLFLSTTLVSALATSSLPSNMVSIIGGTPELHALPWMISLQIQKQKSSVVCSGSLIEAETNSSYIVTAAHCLVGAISITALGGRYDLSKSTEEEGGAVYQVVYTFIHSEYNSVISGNDIALLGVKLVKNYGPAITPISIKSLVSTASTYNAYGWGVTAPTLTKTSSLLMMGKLTPVSQDVCAASYGAGTVTDSVVCAGTSAVTTCKGDSGGPLTAIDSNGTEHLIGITSFGDAVCGNAPSGFTKIDAYFDWINHTTNTTLAMNFANSGEKVACFGVAFAAALMFI